MRLSPITHVRLASYVCVCTQGPAGKKGERGQSGSPGVEVSLTLFPHFQIHTEYVGASVCSHEGLNCENNVKTKKHSQNQMEYKLNIFKLLLCFIDLKNIKKLLDC